MSDSNRPNRHLPGYQSGMVTTFTGVMILVLLTLMMFFAIRVGVFEQRVSANESRQKLAFHVAESGISHAKELLEANSALVARMDELDSGAFGWLRNDANGRWKSCAQWASAKLGSLAALADPDANGVSDEDKWHPCFGGYDPAMRQFQYFYCVDDGYCEDRIGDAEKRALVDTDTVLDTGGTEQVTVEALLCVLDVVEEAGEDVPVKGCHVWDPSENALAPSAPAAVLTEPVGTVGDYLFMVTLLARGEADCSTDTSGNTTACNAEALVGEQVSSFGAAAGGNAPLVPLTTKSSFPPSGSAEVVPNPNAGGVGVPVSVWMNANQSCDAEAVVDPSSGSWATCEMHEWYGVHTLPDDETCPGNCSCAQSESISYTMSNDDVLGIDLVADELFPCDLFQFYFGVPRSDYLTVKSWAKVIDDCSGLDENSFGIYWVTGDSCTINANTQVASLDAPIMLISAAAETRLNGGAKIFGTVFVTDVENAEAELVSVGTNTVYGSVIVDAILGSYQGTFQVVWNDTAARKAPGQGGLGSVLGGWTDFHRDWQ